MDGWVQVGWFGYFDLREGEYETHGIVQETEAKL